MRKLSPLLSLAALAGAVASPTAASLPKVVGAAQPYRGPRFPERPPVAACNKKFRRAVSLKLARQQMPRFDYEARVTVADRLQSRTGQRYFRMVNGQIVRAGRGAL